MENVSGFGSVVSISASQTFAGIPFFITQFSNDADAFDFPSVQIGDAAMGINGDLIVWNKAVPLKGTISVIAGSDNDIALQLIADNNRVGKGKASVNDIIFMNVVYPQGTTVTFNNGIITDSSFARSLGSDGKLKTKVYGFTFESITGA